MAEDLGIGGPVTPQGSSLPGKETQKESVQIDFSGIPQKGSVVSDNLPVNPQAARAVATAAQGTAKELTLQQESPTMAAKGEPQTPMQEQVPEPVIDLEYVNILVEKIQLASKKLTTYKDFYETYKERYDNSLASVKNICEQFMREMYEVEGHKTFALPCGETLKLTKKADCVEFTDYDKALAYIQKNNPEILKTELQISKVRAHFKATGEIIEGTEFKKHKELNFSLTVEKK